jgi:hypothetical protein
MAKSRRVKVYQRAIRHLGKGIGCCQAIVFAKNGGRWVLDSYGGSFVWPSEAEEFSALFRPDDDLNVWWGDQWSEDKQERLNCRILALLLMQAIVDYQQGEERC